MHYEDRLKRQFELAVLAGAIRNDLRQARSLAEQVITEACQISTYDMLQAYRTHIEPHNAEISTMAIDFLDYQYAPSGIQIPPGWLSEIYDKWHADAEARRSEPEEEEEEGDEPSLPTMDEIVS